MYGIPKNSIILFSHVAHYWKKLPYSNYMGGIGKRNDIIIKVLKNLIITTKLKSFFSFN